MEIYFEGGASDIGDEIQHTHKIFLWTLQFITGLLFGNTKEVLSGACYFGEVERQWVII